MSWTSVGVAGATRPRRSTRRRGAGTSTTRCSVITSRALPDVRDGLKPVQRRIVYGMWQTSGSRPTRSTRSAPRSSATSWASTTRTATRPIYDALVRMAQDFSLRYPLVDGHGNFGSLDGDAAAAYRYTECRLTALAADLARARSRAEHRRLPAQLRRHHAGARRAPGAAPAAADERHHRDRGGHGHQHPAAQPERAVRRAGRAGRRTRSSRRRTSSSSSRARTSRPAARS